MLRELRALSPAVRTDFLRVLDGVVGALPAHWRRGKGVPQLWVFLDGPEDSPVVRVERTSLRELSEHGYLDEFSRWAPSLAVSKAREGRCAALIYGNRVHARIWQIGPWGSGRHLPDTFACVFIGHRELGTYRYFSLDFEVHGRLFPRLAFPESVLDLLARARQG